MAGPVNAELGYLDTPHKHDDGRPLHYYADFTGSTNAILKPCAVAVTDARERVADFTLDSHGFTLALWPTHVRDFMDTEAVSAQYVSECAALIRQLTGAAVTYQAGPIHCRFDRMIDPKARYDGKPAHYVHADFSAKAVVQSLPWLPEDLSTYPRYAIYNIWRVLTPPPQSRPLAVCDARSLKPEDAYDSTAILDYPDARGAVEAGTVLYRPNAAHRWHYFSDMTPDEVLVFKSFESDGERAGAVPHCAFQDRTQPRDAVRISVEARIWGAFRP